MIDLFLLSLFTSSLLKLQLLLCAHLELFQGIEILGRVYLLEVESTLRTLFVVVVLNHMVIREQTKPVLLLSQVREPAVLLVGHFLFEPVKNQ